MSGGDKDWSGMESKFLKNLELTVRNRQAQSTGGKGKKCWGTKALK